MFFKTLSNLFWLCRNLTRCCGAATSTLLLLLVLPLNSDALTSAELKTGYIYNIIKNIYWPNETQLNHFTVLYYGNSSGYLKSLKSLQQQSIRGKPIQVRSQNTFKPTANIQVLIIDKRHNNELVKISRDILKSKTLIITEQNTNKANVMINFFNQGNGISFELNRSNIIYEELKLSKNILLVGGTELDVATIYKETEHELQAAKSTLQKQQTDLRKQSTELKKQSLKLKQQIKISRQQENNIKKQKASINQQRSQIDNQKQTINEQQNLIKTREKELEGQQKALLKNLDTLDSIQKELNLSRTTLVKNTSVNLNLNEQIQRNNDILKQQQEKLSALEIETSQQQVEISSKEYQITQQRMFLYLTGSIMLLVIAAIIFIYFNYLQKRKAALVLAQKNQQLKGTMLQLKNTQDQLIESEKMASLGTLVTGVAHEINTPLGVAFTVSSDARERTLKITNLFEQQKVTAQDFSNYCETMQESTELLETNLGKVADLVKSFKEVSVDQSGHQQSSFDLTHYIHEVSSTFQPLLDKHKHTFDLHTAGSLIIDSYPGAFFQIFSTLIMNSITHAFHNLEGKTITIQLSTEGHQAKLVYFDNGPTIDEKIINNIFDPFYTTKRGAGYTGLGCHILYNLSTQLLKGHISCTQQEAGGLKFTIEFPVSNEQTMEQD